MIARIVFGIYRRVVLALAYTFLGPHRLGATTRNAVDSVRLRVLRSSLKSCGEGTSIQLPVCVSAPEQIELADSVSVAAFVHIWGAGGVRIGKRVMIGTHTSISSVTHDYNSDQMWQTVITKEVVIEDDVWIGSNAVVLPGIRVGRGAVIGAGAVVTHDVEAGAIVMGIPARVCGRRALPG